MNGIAGDTKRMQQELETAERVELLLCNPPSISSFRAVMDACSKDLRLPKRPFWQDVAKMPPVGLGEGGSSCTFAAEDFEPSRCITVIITTSPVPSNPSSDLLERVLFSLDFAGLRSCPRIIVCDGYKITSGKSNHKAGKISLAEPCVASN